MEPPPTVVKRGFGPISMVSVTRFVAGSTRETLLCSLLTTQIAPSSPRTQTGEPEGTVISATLAFVLGSILESTPFRSLGIQMLSALAVSPPSLFAGPTGIVATTVLVFMSTREIVLSVQFGTQTLPKAAANPEQGRLPTSTAAMTLLVFGSSRWTVFFGPLETQTASSVTTCQSGVPSTGNTASGVTVAISRFTPGSVIPGFGCLGGRAGAAAGAAGATGSCCAYPEARKTLTAIDAQART